MKAKILLVFILLGLTASASLGGNAQPAQAGTPPPPPPPTVGVIRWDGWYSSPPNSHEQLLAPTQWQNRLPFFAQVINPGNTVMMREDSQAVIDQEIQYAHTAGINYWAFDYYAPADLNPSAAWGDPEYGLHYYLTSPFNNEINFSLILLGGPALGTKADWTTKTVPRIVSLLGQPTYQHVKGTRPLIYVFNLANTISQFGSQTLARAAFDALRQAAKIDPMVMSDPYIVGLAFNPSKDAPNIKALGLNAVSSYDAILLSGKFQQLPYKRLAQANQAFWTQALAIKGMKVVAPVSIGFDPRPVMTTKDGYNRYKSTPYYAQGTPQEIAANLKNALQWTTHHAAAADANTVLVYAWNENAEGGWLTPMLDPTLGNARLNAIGKVLNPGAVH